MKSEWTNWRNSNYEFFRARLDGLSSTLKLYDLGSGAEQFGQVFHSFDYVPVDFQKFNENTVIVDLTTKFPFTDSVADIVTLSNTVEHIPNSEHFFMECSRILKKGGMIIGTVPFLMGVHQAPYDFNRYTPFQLKRLLEIAGFKDVEVQSLGHQIDVYNTIELKVFDELRKQKGGFVLELIRLVRRIEMRCMRKFFKTKAGEKLTEGFGFVGIKK